MATTHPRIQVTLDSKINRQLNALAAEEECSLSSIAVELIREALELREDRALSRHADKRFKRAKKWVSQAEAWGDA